jgi:Putative adhesin
MNNNKKSRMSRLFLLLASTAVLLSLPAWARSPQGQFEKTFSVTGPVNLEVLSRSGDITVTTGSGRAVIVRGKIYVGDRWFTGSRSGDVHALEQNPPVRQDGNSIHIDHVAERDISVDYEITVPADTTIRTRSGSGDQTISGTRGNADLQTGSGDMKLEQITGEVRVETGSGNVRARSIQGPVHGSTGSGDVEIEETGSNGDVDMRTGSGNLTVRGVHGTFRGETGSGDVTSEGDITGPWEIRTGSGNVHVRLPSNAAFEANLSTSSGSLEVNAPVTTTVQGRVEEMHKSIRGQVRGGGPMLTVRTGSGDIHIQ